VFITQSRQCLVDFQTRQRFGECTGEDRLFIRAIGVQFFEKGAVLTAPPA
jgi:hypothetical protein